jgi:hypothetical protein
MSKVSYSRMFKPTQTLIIDKHSANELLQIVDEEFKTANFDKKIDKENQIFWEHGTSSKAFFYEWLDTEFLPLSLFSNNKFVRKSWNIEIKFFIKENNESIHLTFQGDLNKSEFATHISSNQYPYGFKVVKDIIEKAQQRNIVIDFNELYDQARENK